MFSPKVLDRAFTIEFNQVDLSGFGAEISGDSNETSVLGLTKLPSSLLSETSAAVTPKDQAWKAFRQLEGGALYAIVLALHEILEAEGRHFGYRVANEIASFVLLAHGQTGGNPEANWVALDIAILTKVLPKLNGTQQELSTLLVRLFDLTVHGTTPTPTITTEAGVLDSWRVVHGQIGSVPSGGSTPRLARSATKLWAMLRRLRQQGFASFIM